MHNAVRGIDHEDAKQHRHPIRAGSANSGNESKDPNCQEDNTKKHSKCFNHCETSCWFKRLRLWQFAPIAGKRKSRVNRNGHGQMLSKIDNMKLSYLLVAACLAIVVDPSPAGDAPAVTKSAVFAGGCFWCIQPAFDKAPGVIKTTVGYCGGNEPKPTYELVGSEKTKYRESIEIVYDPAKISYDQLLDIYWRQIDPTQADGQFTD